MAVQRVTQAALAVAVARYQAWKVGELVTEAILAAVARHT
jgi:hypothetical protein